jgi:hypothetical protein
MAYPQQYGQPQLHYGLYSFAASGSGAFFGVSAQAGAAPVVLLSIAGILLGRFLIRPSAIIFASALA